MTKYILFTLFIFQFSFGSEKDSLRIPNPFEKYQRTFFLDLEDDCDACGCSASGGSMGFDSMLNANFVGVRYLNQVYRSRNGLYSNSPWYTENYNTAQIWARIPVVKKVQISALIPYQFHNRETASGTQNVSGLGDITLIGMYQLFQTKKDSAVYNHSFQAGIGIKAPTGKFDEANNGSFNPSYQVGTGSWDYLLATEYLIKKKQWGLNTALNYVIKTENDKNYRFGNQFNYSGTLFYLSEKASYSIVPQIGFAGEVYANNYQLGQKVRNTEGSIFFGKVGFEIGKDKFSAGINAMLPLSQNLNAGNLESKYRLSFNLNYSL